MRRKKKVNYFAFNIDNIVSKKKVALQPCEDRFVKLSEPCKACGYDNGNIIKLLGKQAAVKCGLCDTYQYSVSLQQKKGGKS